MPTEGVIASYDREKFICVKGIKSFGNNSGLGEGLWTIHTTKLPNYYIAHPVEGCVSLGPLICDIDEIPE
jgi:hypothetical protein